MEYKKAIPINLGWLFFRSAIAFRRNACVNDVFISTLCRFNVASPKT